MYANRLLLLVLVTLFLHGCGGSADSSKESAGSPKFLAAVISTNGSATFAGARSNYTIAKTATGYTVTDNVGKDGVSNLVNVNALVFTDVTINLTITDKAKTIPVADLNLLTELYVAFFNRVPDADGLAYWIDQFKAGSSIDKIAESFYAAGVQSSAQTGYSSSMTNSDFVKIVYKNVLGRTTVDQEGLDYWTTSLANGSKTRGALVSTILTAAHTFKNDPTYGSVAALLDNKRSVSLNFAVERGINFVSASDAITKSVEIAASITATDTSAAIQRISALFQKILLAPIDRSTSDQPDFVQGAQVHFVYAVPAGGIDRRFDLLPTLMNSTGSWNNWLSGQTGGRKMRIDMINENTVDITYAPLPLTDAQLEAFGVRKRDQIEIELAKLLPKQANKIYAVYYDGINPRVCADAPYPPQLPGQTIVVYLRGLENTRFIPCFNNGFAATQTSTPGYLDMVMIHELLHAQGFVAPNAPSMVFSGHVSTDPTDLMYAGSLPWNPKVLDFNKSNYYNPAGLPNGLPNFSNSAYLISSQ